MKVIALAEISNLHHAYIVAGSAEEGRGAVLSVLEKRGVKTKGNQDVMQFSFTELSVDSARVIASFASLKPVGDAKYIIVSFGRATGEAQNALLKVVEESPGSSVFFFCVGSAGALLLTLRSRCITLDSEYGTLDFRNPAAAEFLKEQYPKRLQRVETMVREAARTQDRAPTREFVRVLLALAHEKKASAQVLRDLSDADRYLRLSGASVKAVLGHLAVSLPLL